MKGIGIIFVILGHLSPGMLLEKHIYSFHMALFFAIAGYTFRTHDSFNLFCAKKAKRLLVPFVLWNTVSILIAYFFHVITLKEAINDFFGLGGTWSWNSPIWFLFILFITETIFYFLHNSRKAMIVVGIICIAVGYMVNNHVLVASVHVIPTALLMMIFGKLIRHYQLRIKYTNKSNSIKLVIAASFLILNLVGTYFNIRISVYHSAYGNYIHALFVAVCGILAYSCIAICINSNRIFEYFGKNSMILVCAQYYIFAGYRVVSSKLLGVDIWHSGYFVIASTLTVITLVIFWLLIEINKCVKNNVFGSR